ncbi:fasciclin [Sphingomonas spermidinifaciens]|uniref:Fasciclin n=1 Tax=Sphingomonas spermidinifaciens TaxID=1141889 RepID=A0A2A4B1Q6_9SPHN|nr:fasciclin domain-containing protein [Sphingomonas spermidinifaciens]PCD01872.1 fasciclin [Sphingomonas spermidinifaciens]
MNRLSIVALAGLAATSSLAMAQTTAPTAPTAAQQQPMAGQAATSTTTTTAAPTATPAAASGTIADTAMSNPKLSTLVSAVKAADLATTLSGPGPFTVFAPENEAFTRLAPGTLDTLLKPENKPTLTKVLTYHVVPGKVTLEQLRTQIKAGGGKTTLTTVEGSPLTVAEEGAAIALTDASGNKSYVAQPDVMASNGVVHVVNGVVVPKLAPAAETSGAGS